ncbi:hypothetical protein AGMMS50262_11350 [Bacteroidia bacterium]|nr:hypothetical protein AGMMS50262_11350 [Bacteroidia bacterium]
MKKYILYLAILGIIFLIMYQLNKDAPVQHTWQPTFNTGDKQPFGDYAFDKVLEKSWEKGYTHSYQSIKALKDAGELENANLLILAHEFKPYKEEMEVLLDYIRQGGNALIAASLYLGAIEDSLKLFTNFDYSAVFNYNLTIEQPKDTFRFCAPNLPPATYLLPTSMSSYYFTGGYTQDSVYTVVEMNTKRRVMLHYPMGKGNLIVSCTPLLFTNYTMLSDSINGFIGNSLAYLQDKPLIRTEYYGVGSQGTAVRSPFRYLLSQKPLRWAFYLTLIAVLLLLIFTAKRKQKIIPVIQPPANKLLAFVNSIAALYIRKNNNADIILKKQIYWAEDLKHRYGIDSINESHNEDFFQRFSLKTGQPLDKVKSLFGQLDTIHENVAVSDEVMMNLIMQMNII